MDSNTLLLDVGGTYIKRSDGRNIPIDSNGSREVISAALQRAVSPLAGKENARLAVAIPGPFDYDSGTFLMKHKFASVYGCTFKEISGFEGEVKYIHDVNCMLMGALKNPEFEEYSRVALITIGTGLGFAYSIDGQIQCTPQGSPAVSLYNRPYKGKTAEDFVSKRGIMDAWCRAFKEPWPEDQTVADIANTVTGEGIFSHMGACLGEIACPVLKKLEIECLLLGGQISKSFYRFNETLAITLVDSDIRLMTKLPNIDTATFDGLKALLR